MQGPTRSIVDHPASASASDETRPVDQAGAREGGELVWILPVTRQAGGRWTLRPARDGSAASHLEGLELSMQAGPPPSSRATIVPHAARFGNNAAGPIGGPT
jgi:hypothetical protein